ncbi:DNA polymerase-4 [Sporobacter termitidis DSM 10068]|uniref:DNA polymerase IV n=1 Tax=Sporobacter termitidis DSM 10068 TaxID=1123282 RepID=A0A1M5WVI9_9FIRM|nr:DNA polymerase IV [Sporobacter termitidis]SHH91607.1 DNA polymerase-4 [Sporobacter termitidis DSM 10068]
MNKKIIYHVDVNSAFLSWTAAYQVGVLGKRVDLRNVPAVIAGDKEARRSIVLAKSIPAKAYGIRTGEPLFEAKGKCPHLIVERPDYDLYVEASRRLIALLREFTPIVEQYSIDEAYADVTGMDEACAAPVAAAEKLKERIKTELGFTVNIGISSNKLLSKMAGDFLKPDKVHTLFPREIEEKMWPLPVRDLFLVGPATERKLRAFGINTIGELAKADLPFLKAHLKKQGEVIWNYANGRGYDDVTDEAALNKGYGNSATTPFDVTDRATAHRVLLSLCETVGMRMRRDGQTGAVMTVSIRSNQFADKSRQAQMMSHTNVTGELYHYACRVFDDLWDRKTPLRQLGVHVARVDRDGCRQFNIWDGQKYARLEKLDAAVDAIREKFGEESICRACFIGDVFSPMGGGLSKSRRTGVTKPV